MARAATVYVPRAEARAQQRRRRLPFSPRLLLAGGAIMLLASGPTLAYGSIRRAVAFSAGHDLTASLAQEAEYMARTGASADHRAAVAAFLAKEKPTFTGS